MAQKRKSPEESPPPAPSDDLCLALLPAVSADTRETYTRTAGTPLELGSLQQVVKDVCWSRIRQGDTNVLDEHGMAPVHYFAAVGLHQDIATLLKEGKFRCNMWLQAGSGHTVRSLARMRLQDLIVKAGHHLMTGTGQYQQLEMACQRQMELVTFLTAIPQKIAINVFVPVDTTPVGRPSSPRYIYHPRPEFRMLHAKLRELGYNNMLTFTSPGTQHLFNRLDRLAQLSGPHDEVRMSYVGPVTGDSLALANGSVSVADLAQRLSRFATPRCVCGCMCVCTYAHQLTDSVGFCCRVGCSVVDWKNRLTSACVTIQGGVRTWLSRRRHTAVVPSGESA